MVRGGLFARALPFLGVGAAFLVAGEVALRVAGFEYLSDVRRVVVWSKEEDPGLFGGTGLHVYDRKQMWKPRPGARIPWTKDERINEQGFRGPALPLAKTPGVLRIAVIGSSTSFGVGVPWHDTYSALLERNLALRGVRAEVIDAAVMHSTVRQGLERYRLDVRPFKPDIVISSYSGLNEHLQAPGCITDDERLGQGIAMVEPEELASPSLRDRVRVAQVACWLHDVFLGGFWKERENQMMERRLAKTIGEFEGPGIRRVSPPLMRDSMVELASEVRKDGAELIELLVPHAPGGPLDSPVMLYYQKAAEIGCELDHVPIVHGRLAYFEGVRFGIAPGDLFQPDGESSDCGHTLLAQALCDAIFPRVPAIVK